MRPQFDQDDSVYETVTQDEYTKIVQKRRSEQSFVVDDGASAQFDCSASPLHILPRLVGAGGLGYADDGEEHLGAPDLNTDEPLVDKDTEGEQFIS